MSVEQSVANGSSPHTRGAQQARPARPAQVGIIPAYAGSTRRVSVGLVDRRDHPRIRGEHSVRSTRERTLFGSSPHTRGARRQNEQRGYVLGIIPAYAGSTE